MFSIIQEERKKKKNDVLNIPSRAKKKQQHSNKRVSVLTSRSTF